MRISDWSSDVCSSDLVFTVEESRALRGTLPGGHVKNLFLRDKKKRCWLVTAMEDRAIDLKDLKRRLGASGSLSFGNAELLLELLGVEPGAVTRSEEHTSELQSLMRISYAVFCLTKKKTKT